jgi:hypothetical protein
MGPKAAPPVWGLRLEGAAARSAVAGRAEGGGAGLGLVVPVEGRLMGLIGNRVLGPGAD